MIKNKYKKGSSGNRNNNQEIGPNSGIAPLLIIN